MTPSTLHCCCCCCLVSQLCPTLCDPTDCSPPGSSVHGDSGYWRYWSGLPCSPPGDLPNPGIKPRSSTLQADSLLSVLPGKPENSRVGSLSLPQGIFLTQESHWGPLHCRRVLHQLRHRERFVLVGRGLSQLGRLWLPASYTEFFSVMPHAQVTTILSADGQKWVYWSSWAG